MINRCLWAIVILIAGSANLYGQIHAQLSSGLSFTTTNPRELQTFDLTSKVDSSFGWEYQLGFSGDVTEKIRYLFRVGYNRHRVHVFHSKKYSQNLTEQIDGRLSSSYLSFMVAPLFHRGGGIEFTYGLGFYAGFRLQQNFNGVIRIIEDNKTEVYPQRNTRPESYRELSTGLFTTVGLHRYLGSKVKVGATADLILFLNAKNFIFEDTGSTNEINLRLGLSYLIQPRMDNL